MSPCGAGLSITPNAGKALAQRGLADELERSVGAMEELKNPAALMQGSAAAFSQVLKIQNAGKGETAAEKLLRIQQQY